MDGVKLILKEYFYILNTQVFFFIMAPALSLILFIVAWTWLLPWLGDFFLIKYSSIFFFGVLGLSAYSVILSGWRRFRRFSKLGRLRGVLQNLSFEIALIFIFFNVLIFLKIFLMKREVEFPYEMYFFFSSFWAVISLIETNRAPFDLIEGESELIRGFNIEIGRIPFVFLFLREYGIIIILSLLWRFSLFGNLRILIIGFLRVLLFCRRCFPRLRYDLMITIIWIVVLPTAFFYLLVHIIRF